MKKELRNSLWDSFQDRVEFVLNNVDSRFYNMLYDWHMKIREYKIFYRATGNFEFETGENIFIENFTGRDMECLDRMEEISMNNKDIVKSRLFRKEIN